MRSFLAEEGGGWVTVSRAAVRLPRGEATAGLHLECVAENPRTGASLAQAAQGARTPGTQCHTGSVEARGEQQRIVRIEPSRGRTRRGVARTLLTQSFSTIMHIS